MKLFKYGSFVRESRDDIDSICKKYGIENYTINNDGSIDVDGDVNLSYSDLNKLPLTFRNVSGYFGCYSNELTNLLGSPISVGGNFHCGNNKLTSLEGSPKEVGDGFYCNNNQLTSLEGISQEIRGKKIDCSHNLLVNVKGIKEGWRGKLWIDNNPVYEIFDLLFKDEYDEYDEVVELLNEYDVIKEEGVNLQALEQVFIDMDKEFTFFRNYKTIL
jgi:hypothetical protein